MSTLPINSGWSRQWTNSLTPLSIDSNGNASGGTGSVVVSEVSDACKGVLYVATDSCGASAFAVKTPISYSAIVITGPLIYTGNPNDYSVSGGTGSYTIKWPTKICGEDAIEATDTCNNKGSLTVQVIGSYTLNSTLTSGCGFSEMSPVYKYQNGKRYKIYPGVTGIPKAITLMTITDVLTSTLTQSCSGCHNSANFSYRNSRTPNGELIFYNGRYYWWGVS